jgi:hypothetical protein
MNQLYQPILASTPVHVPNDRMSTATFIALLCKEEDYYSGEQEDTCLMITRLRKIFYDQWGWNTELIEGAAAIEMRYVVTIVNSYQRRQLVAHFINRIELFNSRFSMRKLELYERLSRKRTDGLFQ